MAPRGVFGALGPHLPPLPTPEVAPDLPVGGGWSLLSRVLCPKEVTRVLPCGTMHWAQPPWLQPGGRVYPRAIPLAADLRSATWSGRSLVVPSRGGGGIRGRFRERICAHGFVRICVSFCLGTGRLIVRGVFVDLFQKLTNRLSEGSHQPRPPSGFPQTHPRLVRSDTCSSQSPSVGSGTLSSFSFTLLWPTMLRILSSGGFASREL